MKKKFTAKKFVIACAICVAACTSSQAKDIYLAPTGSDKNDGLSDASPLATISRAFTVAEDNDIIHVTGFIDISKEPKSAIATNDLLMDGSCELIVDGVVYNTWNAQNGVNGIKPLAKALTIIGDNKNTSGFDGKFMTRLFKIDRRAEAKELGAKSLVFKNMTLKGGACENSGDSGGAIYLRNMDDTSFEDCVFIDNYGSNNGASSSIRGGAVFVTLEEGAITSFKNCDFTYNEAGNGGVFYVSSGILDVSDCSFEDNSNEYMGNSKGGVFYFFTNEGNSIIASIERCTFINNTTSQYGGVAFYRDGGNAAPREANITFKDCFITGSAANQENGEGGVFYIDNSNASIKMNFSVINCTIYDNKAALSGGVLMVDNTKEGSVLNIVNSTIIENKCEGRLVTNAGNSGGIRFKNIALPLKKNVYNSIIEGNYSVTTEGEVPSDMTGQGPAHFIAEFNANLSNSYIGFIACDDFDSSGAVDCVLGYGAEKQAGLADDINEYIKKYKGVPLKNDAVTKTAGNARFLIDLGINTDQLGRTRSFENNTCYIGAIEADEASIGSNSSTHHVDRDAAITVYQSAGKLYVQSIDSEPIEIAIYHISGACIKIISGDIAQDGYSVGELKGGVYLVKITQNGYQSVSQKILIQ